jgi:hypothetical protein
MHAEKRCGSGVAAQKRRRQEKLFKIKWLTKFQK